MKHIKKIIKENNLVSENILKHCVNQIAIAVETCIDCIEKKNKIVWCGNGGSEADSQHMAAELMGGLTSHNRPPIKSIALTTDSSFLTAWSNDTNFSTVFSRQISGLCNEGDVLMAISTSGNSKNIIEALKTAKKLKMISILLSGKAGGNAINICDFAICVPSKNTQRIQEGHLLIEHILCESIERAFK